MARISKISSMTLLIVSLETESKPKRVLIIPSCCALALKISVVIIIIIIRLIHDT